MPQYTYDFFSINGEKGRPEADIFEANEMVFINTDQNYYSLLTFYQNYHQGISVHILSFIINLITANFFPKRNFCLAFSLAMIPS